MAALRLKKQKPFPRGAGTLLPVSCLPSPYGIGTFGAAAYAMVDFLHMAGQRYWQVLPLGPTSYGDSPYQSLSAFAGNPYYIDLDLLVEQGLLKPEEISAHNWGTDRTKVDYEALFDARYQVLGAAFARSKHQDTPAYQAFCAANAFWLEDYALYMALKAHFAWVEWAQWPAAVQQREPSALREYATQLAEQVAFWKFTQFLFFRQWDALKVYAHEKDIEIIGDIPIYVAYDSADVWANSHLFELDEERRPIYAAGVPPDLFSETGQLWGNPLYRWDVMQAEDFAWWKSRIHFSARMFDIIRIDHFIGIVNYYCIPAGEDTAQNGWWRTGPGDALIAAINAACGESKIIAEDLGVITRKVRRLQKRSGYPGMKLMTFAFDSDWSNEYLPCHFEQNTVAYGGTHDNETLAGYFARQDRALLARARMYLNIGKNRDIVPALIVAGYASTANTVIFQLQDYLGLDNTARINTPSTLGGNWQWRLGTEVFAPELAQQLMSLCEIYDRLPVKS